MKLGFIRMPDQHLHDAPSIAITSQLKLADELGIHIAYLPTLLPRQLLALGGAQTKTLKIALDATSFGRMAPREMERSVRQINDALQERLYLGIDICCDSSCARQRSQAQEFETIFAYGSVFGQHLVNAPFPMKAPCPKILGLPVQGTTQEIAFAAARGYMPMTPSYLSAADAAHHWPAMVAGATSALRRAKPRHWQIARNIVIHDDRATREAYVFGAKSPIRKHYNRLNNLGLLKDSVDTHLKNSVIAGSSQQVADKILALKETAGDIGTLYFIDHPQSDANIARDTMVRLVQNVMPQLKTTDIRTFKELENT
jgi:hypothetical protein